MKLDFKQAGNLFEGVFGNLTLLYEYGSKKVGSDTDLFAVYNGEAETSNIKAGNIDLWVVNEKDFERLASLLDPFVTEPILTGELIFSKSDIEPKNLLGNRPTQETISYLIKRSFDILDFSSSLLSDESSNREFWSSLSFAVSYWLFAKQYSNNWTRVLSLDELLSEVGTEYREFWDDVISRKNRKSDQEKSYISSWSNLILKEKSIYPR